MTGHVTPIKIFGTGTVSVVTNDVAAIDIPEDGEILAILGTLNATGMADADRASVELSFLSTNQIQVNDARGSILEVTIRSVISTNGGLVTAESVALSFTPGSGIPVNAGERIHLHTEGTSGVTPVGMFMIYLSAGRAKRASRRR